MKTRAITIISAAGLAAALAGVGLLGLLPARPADAQGNVGRKNVPILTVGSNLNVGLAQVEGPKASVDKVKAVAQLETDFKDMARIRILVPISTERVVQNITRVPGVALVGMVDYEVLK